jgi:nucleoside-diphosphate-sugar epimerase
LNNIPHIKPKLDKILTGDIGDRDTISLVKENNPEIIFHLAASAYVPFSFDHPDEVMKANLMGTLNILEAAKSSKKIKQIVCTSSSEIYGTAKYVPIDELHPLNPSSPYAASKVAADRYCYAYWNTYGIPVAIIRPFNMFGPRHTYDVIPKFIYLALHDKPLTVYGEGEQKRDFLYVDDAVRAFLVMASNKKAIGQAVNFGTEKDYSINYIAKKIIELSGSKSKIIHIKKRTSEVDRLNGSYQKAKKLFGWKPKISFEEGLRRNIEWAKHNPKWNKDIVG